MWSTPHEALVALVAEALGAVEIAAGAVDTYGAQVPGLDLTRTAEVLRRASDELAPELEKIADACPGDAQ